jgi:hypothetical protein
MTSGWQPNGQSRVCMGLRYLWWLSDRGLGAIVREFICLSPDVAPSFHLPLSHSTCCSVPYDSLPRSFGIALGT